MSVLDLSQADEKMASLDMVLKADSGYRATSKGDRISANQWSDILRITSNPEAYRKIRAADDMLAALQAIDTFWTNSFPDGPEGSRKALGGLGTISDDTIEVWRTIRAALSRALGEGERS